MTAAIFGLVGVIVGGLITTGGDVFRAWLGNRAEVRQACRLLEVDLATLMAMARGAANGDPPNAVARERFLRVPQSWEEHRGTLARALSNDEWRALAAAMFSVQIVQTSYEDNVDEESVRPAWADLQKDVAEAHDRMMRRL